MAKKEASAQEEKYRIPPEKDALDAIRNVMMARGIIHSQGRLRNLVERELAAVDKAYRISGQRVRMLAIQHGVVTVEIHFRDSERKANVYKCPVCDGKLKMVHNKTIFGGTVTLAKECTRCPYWVGLKLHVPTRYVFTLSPEFMKRLEKRKAKKEKTKRKPKKKPPKKKAPKKKKVNKK